jgi:hypothetical protein
MPEMRNKINNALKTAKIDNVLVSTVAIHSLKPACLYN